MGGSPPPYIASPRVDPRLDMRGGTMHIPNGCSGAVGDCWRKLGLIGPNKGSAEPFCGCLGSSSVGVFLVGSMWGSQGAFLEICWFSMSFGP